LAFAVVRSPGSGYVAFCAGQRWDVIDVDSVGDEEDALDGVVWEWLAGCGVDGFHCDNWLVDCRRWSVISRGGALWVRKGIRDS